jgi:hypothetical protein
MSASSPAMARSRPSALNVQTTRMWAMAVEYATGWS